jgi:hypothetical protein
LDVDDFDYSHPEGDSAVAQVPGLSLFRDRGAINGTVKYQYKRRPHRLIYKTRKPLIERVASASLSIINTDGAPYTIIVLVDRRDQLVVRDMSRDRGEPDLAADCAFPDILAEQTTRMKPSERATGLSQFFVLVLTLLTHWEDDWLKTLAALDDMTKFAVSAPRLLRSLVLVTEITTLPY